MKNVKYEPQARRMRMKTASKVYDVPYSTLRQEAAAGRLPVTRINRTVYVSVADMEALFEDA